MLFELSGVGHRHHMPVFDSQICFSCICKHPGLILDEEHDLNFSTGFNEEKEGFWLGLEERLKLVTFELTRLELVRLGLYMNHSIERRSTGCLHSQHAITRTLNTHKVKNEDIPHGVSHVNSLLCARTLRVVFEVECCARYKCYD